MRKNDGLAPAAEGLYHYNNTVENRVGENGREESGMEGEIPILRKFYH